MDLYKEIYSLIRLKIPTTSNLCFLLETEKEKEGKKQCQIETESQQISLRSEISEWKHLSREGMEHLPTAAGCYSV